MSSSETPATAPETHGPSGRRTYMMRDLPDWWERFNGFCKTRHIPMRTVVLWLVSRFLSEDGLQQQYAAWLMSKEKKS